VGEVSLSCVQQADVIGRPVRHLLGPQRVSRIDRSGFPITGSEFADGADELRVSAKSEIEHHIDYRRLDVIGHLVEVRQDAYEFRNCLGQLVVEDLINLRFGQDRRP
jgi:hypothetical protein